MMDDRRKNAYRFLIYWAMLDVRGIEWITHQPWRLLNPLTLRRALRRAARAGATANWLHNLANASSEDFHEFNEEWFWQDYDRLVKRHGATWDYREIFDRRIKTPSEGEQAAT